jgi:hypothetical protein
MRQNQRLSLGKAIRSDAALTLVLAQQRRMPFVVPLAPLEIRDLLLIFRGLILGRFGFCQKLRRPLPQFRRLLDLDSLGRSNARWRVETKLHEWHRGRIRLHAVEVKEAALLNGVCCRVARAW